MKKRRLIVRNRRRKQIYLAIFVTIFLLFGLGYASMGADLGISGSLGVNRFDRSLYTAFKREATKGYAVEYSGVHQDSLSGTGSEKIYHWYADNDAKGIEILNRNNVIFANQCWQMVRTTDTGGVKLIYNGEVEEGSCYDTRGGHVGYSSLTSISLSGSYYYGTSYNYDASLNTFTLAGSLEQATWDDATASSLVGKYTCLDSSENGSCAILYYVESYASSSAANVIPLDGNSNYSQFGTLPFNSKNNSLAYTGYMYNTVYPSLSGFGTSEDVVRTATIDTSFIYYFSDSAPQYKLNAETGEYEWVFDSTYQISDLSEANSLVGKYTFRKTVDERNEATLQNIISVSGDTYSYVNLVEGGSRDRYYVSDEYVDNGDGTYRVLSAMIFDASNWASNYGRLQGKYVCKNGEFCSNVWFTTATTETGFSYSNIVSVYKYGSGFTYDGTNYSLSGDVVSFWNVGDNVNSINSHHYTCWNNEGTCSEIYYIHYVDGSTPYYIRLSGGKSAEDAFNEMLNASDVNQISSTMKNGIEAWYRRYLNGYDDYLEDAIYCNDRSILNLNGWNSTDGNVSLPLQFKNASITNDLSCTNEKDRFSVGNVNARLNYKVGMLTTAEINLYNNPYPRRTAQFYSLLTPSQYGSGSNIYRVDYDGIMYGALTTINNGVRPVISLAPGAEFVSGDGSMATPYVIETE